MRSGWRRTMRSRSACARSWRPARAPTPPRFAPRSRTPLTDRHRLPEDEEVAGLLLSPTRAPEHAPRAPRSEGLRVVQIRMSAGPLRDATRWDGETRRSRPAAQEHRLRHFPADVLAAAGA